MTLGELFCGIGIVMHMELVKFSAKEEYWTSTRARMSTTAMIMSGKLGEKVVLDRTSELPVRAAPTHPSCTLVPSAQTDVARSGKHVMRCRSEPTGIADVARRVRSLCCKFTTSTKYRPRRAPTVNPEYSSVSPALAGYITHFLRETRAGACAVGHRHRVQPVLHGVVASKVAARRKKMTRGYLAE